MYKIIKNVIDSGRFELSDMLYKIDTLWLQNDITSKEKEELVAFAREKADPTQGVSIVEKMNEFDKRLKLVEEKLTTEPGKEYPDYVAVKWYYKDDKITYNGKKYVCIAPDKVVCTWHPDEYPAYWKLVQ